MQILLCCGKHKLDPVQLIYFAGTWIVVDGNNVGFRMLTANFLDDTFSYDVVRQASKRLDADDVRDTAVDEFHHLSGQEPSFTGLISGRNDGRSHFCKITDICGWCKVAEPRVGIVGEILVKFLPAANNHLAELLESEGAEAVVPDLIDFMCYCFYNQNFKVENLGFKKSKATMANWGIKAIEWVRKPASEALAQSRHFAPPADIRDLAKMASPIVSTGNQTGEGWFLTGEMMELIHGDVPNIVCIQPFGCLPNHIVGKGVIKEIRREYPTANIVAIDYDPGASEVNQLNRIKLMLSTAHSLEEFRAEAI